MLRAAVGVGLAAAIFGPAAAQTADWRKPDPANLLLLDTTKGQVLVELSPEIAPKHVARIRALVRSGFYDRAQFYRVIKGFMAQTGAKGGKIVSSGLPDLQQEFTFQKSAVPNFAELKTSPEGAEGFVGALPVVIDASGTGHVVYCAGVAAMAHANGAPNSGNSQIFFMRGRSLLDKNFSAWGRVLQGQEAVDALKDGEPPPAPDLITRARIVVDLPAAQRPQVEVMDTRGPAFAQVYAEQLMKYGANLTPCVVPIPVKKPGEAWPPAPAATPATPSEAPPSGAPAPTGAVSPPGT